MSRKTDAQRIAEHLNHLRAMSAPVEYTGQSQYSLMQGPWGRREAIQAELARLAGSTQNRAAVDLAEIRRAACTGTDADLSTEKDPYWEAPHDHCMRPHTVRLVQAVEGQIVARVNADNQRAKEEYEAYRRACEQGVAVPPEE